MAAGGTCGIGGPNPTCVRAPPDAQDCNTPSSGLVCCLPLQQDGGGGGGADSCTDECGYPDTCPAGLSCCSPPMGIAGCTWCGTGCPH
jgi:hypothetical protein